MTVLDSRAADTGEPLEMAIVHADARDTAREGGGSLRGIVTGVVAGGLIWLAVLALIVL